MSTLNSTRTNASNVPGAGSPRTYSKNNRNSDNLTASSPRHIATAPHTGGKHARHLAAPTKTNTRPTTGLKRPRPQHTTAAETLATEQAPEAFLAVAPRRSRRRRARRGAMAESSFQIPAAARKGMSQFVVKLYTLLETSDPSIVCWAPDGTSFLVHSPQQFGSKVLGVHFKSSQFSSFIRQLNFYSFHKVQTGSHSGTWEFRHPKFVRGRLDLMKEIKRKTSSEYHVAYDHELKQMRQTISDLRTNVGNLQSQLAGAMATIERLQREKEAALATAHAARKALAAAGVTPAPDADAHGSQIASDPFAAAVKSERRAKRRRTREGVPGGAPKTAVASGTGAGAGAGAAAPQPIPAPADVPFSFGDMGADDTLPDDLFDSLLNMELADDTPAVAAVQGNEFDELDLSWLGDGLSAGTGAGSGTGSSSGGDVTMSSLSPVPMQRGFSDASMTFASTPTPLGSFAPATPAPSPMADVRARVSQLPAEDQQQMAVHLFKLLKEGAQAAPKAPSAAAETLETQVPPQQLLEVLMQLPAVQMAVMAAATAATAADAALHLAAPAMLQAAGRAAVRP